MTTAHGQRNKRKSDPRTVLRLSQKFTKQTARKDKAAILLAEDELTDEAIASEVGVTRRTLANWKQDPEFAALVGDYHGKIIAQALKLPIARKHYRIAVLNDLHERALQSLDERGARYAQELAEEDSAEGATRRFFGNVTPQEAATGLFIREESVNATGMKTVNWRFDSAITKDIRDTEKQAAQELGQWEDTLNVNHGGTVQQEYVIVEDVPWGDATDDDE